MRSLVRQALGLTAVSGLLFFIALGSVDLWDEDEPIFAGAAREMLTRREWIVPYFNGLMLPDKPVFSYWVMIAGYKLFGETEFAARAGSALFSIGTVLLTWQLGRRMFSPRAGAWAGLMLASSLSFLIVARAATPDAVLTFFCTLAMLGFVWSQGAARTFALAGGYAAMGMAVLTKGPIGVLLPMATIGLYLLLSMPHLHEPPRRGSETPWRSIRQLLFSIASRFRPRCLLAAIRSMHPLLAIAIVLAVASPWYIAVGLRTEGAWLSGFFGKHNLDRFLQPMEHHRGPIYYYPLAVVVFFFPWSLFLGPAAVYVRSRLRAGSDDRRAYCLLLCWIAVYLAFFSMAATKLPNYIVPVYPALALLTGAWLDAWLSGACVVRPWLLRTAWIALAAVGLAASVALPLVVRHFCGGGLELSVIGLPLMAGGLVCWWWYERSLTARAMTAFAVSTILFWLAVFGFGSVQVGRHQTSRQFADCVQRHSLTSAPMVRTFGYWRPSFVYYLGRHVEKLHSDEQVRSFCRHWPQGGFLLVSGDRYARIADLMPPGVTILERGSWFLRKNELLLLGRSTAETSLETVAWKTSRPR